MAVKDRVIALSFDVEEFDVPIENGASLTDVPFERQMEISTKGLERIFAVLDRQGVKATFFCTAAFALSRPDLIRRMTEHGHEVASHSFNHSTFETADLARSKQTLEYITGVEVRGYRTPRMGAVSATELYNAGYKWDSSLNPCFLPGRYNHFSEPRMPYREKCGLVELPASVSNGLRFPLFWLAIHNFPLRLYKHLCGKSLQRTGFLNIYTHPWEFSDNLYEKDLRIQYIIRRNSGLKMVARYESVIEYLKRSGGRFVTLSELADKV